MHILKQCSLFILALFASYTQAMEVQNNPQFQTARTLLKASKQNYKPEEIKHVYRLFKEFANETSDNLLKQKAYINLGKLNIKYDFRKLDNLSECEEAITLDANMLKKYHLFGISDMDSSPNLALSKTYFDRASALNANHQLTAHAQYHRAVLCSYTTRLFSFEKKKENTLLKQAIRNRPAPKYEILAIFRFLTNKSETKCPLSLFGYNKQQNIVNQVKDVTRDYTENPIYFYVGKFYSPRIDETAIDTIRTLLASQFDYERIENIIRFISSSGQNTPV